MQCHMCAPVGQSHMHHTCSARAHAGSALASMRRTGPGHCQLPAVLVFSSIGFKILIYVNHFNVKMLQLENKFRDVLLISDLLIIKVNNFVAVTISRQVFHFLATLATNSIHLWPIPKLMN